MAHVYISHSPVDLDPLLQVHEALRKAGIADWYPTSPDKATDQTLIAEKIEEAFALVLLVSSDAMRSRTVQAELEMAAARGLPIVPYRLDKARLGGIFKTLVTPVLKHHADNDGALGDLITELRGLHRRRCPVLAVMNLKGGVGKTTTTAQLFGAVQARSGSRVLLVDLDPQYNLTQVFFDMEIADARAAADRSAISLFERSRIHSAAAPSPAEAWDTLATEPFNPPSPGELAVELLGRDGPPGRFDLISGQFEISKYAFANDRTALAAVKANFQTQIEALRSRYDLIVFDTNPNATFLTECALEAADRVLAPMQPDMYSLRGVRLLNKVMGSLVAPASRPQLSVLFNTVHRREQSSFEADARNGVFNDTAGFKLSDALISTALPRSGHLSVGAPAPDEPAWRQLIVHHGRGGGLRDIRDSLDSIASELEILLRAQPSLAPEAA